MTKSVDAREIALDILIEVLERGGYSHVVIRQALSKYQYLDKQDRAFISRVAEGTLEYLLQIDYIIDSRSKVKVKKMKPVIRCILRMSVYQLFYMDRIPDSAVCNEAVKLSVRRGFSGLKGFVNGVLRNIARQKEDFFWPDDSVRYSTPSWIIDMWSKSYDRDTVETMLRSFLQDKRTTVRLNLTRADRNTVLESLKSQNVTAIQSELADDVVCLEGYDYLEGLRAFQEGFIQVQDLSSVLAGRAASPREGDVVIDVCGAPGGKSLHIADLLNGTGNVEVRDLTPSKVALVEENIARSGLKNVVARVQDARIPTEESVASADLVLADLPCSGLGVIGRKPDIKYHMTPDKLESLAELQREILSVVYRYVKPGGRLVYSTCTIDERENEENVRWFLENFPFDPVDLTGVFGDKIEIATMKEGYIQLLPGVWPCDGFFIAVFARRNDVS